MDTVLNIGGTTYTSSQRAAAKIAYDDLSLSLEGYGSLSFHESGKGPSPSWNDWTAVSVTQGGTTIYSGYITRCQSGDSDEGWKHGYVSRDARWAVDKLVPVEGYDGTGQLIYNRAADDPYGAASDKGLSLGTIFQRVLCVTNTANRITNILGSSTYASLSPPTLNSATVTDLGNLNVVPTQPVTFVGKSVLSQMASHLNRWMPRYAMTVGADGIIRFKDLTSTTDFTPRTVTLPSRYGTGDPIPFRPSIERNSEDVANRYVARGGPQVEAAMLSLVDGTLAEGFTSTDKTNWTYYDFISPKGATDVGNLSAVTSTSATMTSDDATVNYATNFWSNNEATIFLIDTVSTGIAMTEERTVTSNTAMVAGGSATAHWDSAWPTTSSTYTRYRIVGQSGSGIDTWRLYYVREPHTGNTGINTFIGSHLVRKSPRAVRWANASKSFGEYYTQAMIVGNFGVTVPAQVEPVPSLGGFRFKQPTVAVFGQPSKLKQGSPTTVNDGLPADVQILALYSRGALSTTYPADVGGVAQYGGTANTAGIHITEYLDYSGWIDAGSTSDMSLLAQEHCKATQDVVYDVSFDWAVGHANNLPAWSFMVLNYSLNLAIAGTTSPWSAINAPIREVRIRWTAGPRSPSIQSIGFSASNRARPFTGDDLYLHPAFAAGSPLGGEELKGGLFGTGIMPVMTDALGDALRGAATLNDRYLASNSQAAANVPTNPNAYLPTQADFAAFGMDMSGESDRRDGNQFTGAGYKGLGFVPEQIKLPNSVQSSEQDRARAENRSSVGELDRQRARDDAAEESRMAALAGAGESSNYKAGEEGSSYRSRDEVYKESHAKQDAREKKAADERNDIAFRNAMKAFVDGGNES